jgi:DNA-binding transcriptional regulator GbsR (MarR family)
VYTDYKHGRKTVLTQIRKIDGDIMAMERMLREELQEPKLHSRVDEITKSITLHGKYRKKVAQWLEKFGF